MYALIWRRRSVKPQQRSPKRREFLLNSALKQSSHNIDGGSSGREEYFIKRAHTTLHKRRDENQNRVITFFVWVSWRASSCLNNTIWLLSVAADSLSVKVKHVYFKTQTQPGQRKNNNNGTQFQMASHLLRGHGMGEKKAQALLHVLCRMQVQTQPSVNMKSRKKNWSLRVAWWCFNGGELCLLQDKKVQPGRNTELLNVLILTFTPILEKCISKNKLERITCFVDTFAACAWSKTFNEKSASCTRTYPWSSFQGENNNLASQLLLLLMATTLFEKYAAFQIWLFIGPL